jgi:hypothetical protein
MGLRIKYNGEKKEEVILLFLHYNKENVMGHEP